MNILQIFQLKMDNRGLFVQDLTSKMKFRQKRSRVCTRFEAHLGGGNYFCGKEKSYERIILNLGFLRNMFPVMSISWGMLLYG